MPTADSVAWTALSDEPWTSPGTESLSALVSSSSCSRRVFVVSFKSVSAKRKRGWERHERVQVEIEEQSDVAIFTYP